jgi:uncharacterized protein (TIGR00251 family)
MVKVQIKVVPQSKANKVEECKLDEKGNLNLKIRVTAPATDNKANKAVIELLAKHFELRKSDIEIILGHTSRQKVIAIHNTDKNKFLKNTQLNLI